MRGIRYWETFYLHAEENCQEVKEELGLWLKKKTTTKKKKQNPKNSFKERHHYLTFNHQYLSLNWWDSSGGSSGSLGILYDPFTKNPKPSLWLCLTPLSQTCTLHQSPTLYYKKTKTKPTNQKKKKNRTGVFLLLISTFLIISNNTQHIRIEVTLSWGQCELSNFTYLWPLALKLLQRVALRWHTKAARQAEYISCFLHCLCSSEMPGSALTLAEIRNWELAWAVCLFTWGTAQDWAKSHVWLTQ